MILRAAGCSRSCHPLVLARLSSCSRWSCYLSSFMHALSVLHFLRLSPSSWGLPAVVLPSFLLLLSLSSACSPRRGPGLYYIFVVLPRTLGMSRCLLPLVVSCSLSSLLRLPLVSLGFLSLRLGLGSSRVGPVLLVGVSSAPGGVAARSVGGYLPRRGYSPGRLPRSARASCPVLLGGCLTCVFVFSL